MFSTHKYVVHTSLKQKNIQKDRTQKNKYFAQKINRTNSNGMFY